MLFIFEHLKLSLCYFVFILWFDLHVYKINFNEISDTRYNSQHLVTNDKWDLNIRTKNPLMFTKKLGDKLVLQEPKDIRTNELTQKWVLVTVCGKESRGNQRSICQCKRSDSCRNLFWNELANMRTVTSTKQSYV